MFKKTALLLAGAFAASTALQPVPAHARGEGAAVALGAIAGLVVAAAANTAARQQACQQWLPVVNDPRYDAATRQHALQTVTGCGLSVSYVAPAAPQPQVVYVPAPVQTAPRSTDLTLLGAAPGRTPLQHGGTEVRLESTGGGYSVTAVINGAGKLRMLLDTGASSSSIPIEVAVALFKMGRLTEDDIRGPMRFTLADGSSVHHQTVTLNIALGARAVNTRVSVSPAGSDPLLGFDVLKQFGSYMIDNRRGVLVLNY